MRPGWWAALLCAGCATPTVAPAPDDPGRANGSADAVAAGAGATDVDAPDPVDREQRIARAISELGAADIGARERALETLATIGRTSVPRLKAARDRSRDPEVRARIAQALEVLGEEGVYVEAIALLLRERLREAKAELKRYSDIARGRFAEQARYLAGQLESLHLRQEGGRAITGDATSQLLAASPEQLWQWGTNFHNVFLFFRDRDVAAPNYFASARDFYEMAADKKPTYRRAWSCLAALHAAGGTPDEAAAALAKATALPVASGWDLMDLAVYHAASGDADAAIETLRQALQRCENEAREANQDIAEARRWARVSNDFDALRKDPRFRELVRDR